MNNEQKKQYLKSYQRAVRREQEIREEIQRLRGLKSAHTESAGKDPEYDRLMKKEIEKLRREGLRQAKIYWDIEDRIRRMKDDNEQRVLRLRYIQGLSWEQVAVEMSYSWRGVHNIHSRALQNFTL